MKGDMIGQARKDGRWVGRAAQDADRGPQREE